MRNIFSKKKHSNLIACQIDNKKTLITRTNSDSSKVRIMVLNLRITFANYFEFGNKANIFNKNTQFIFLAVTRSFYSDQTNKTSHHLLINIIWKC